MQQNIKNCTHYLFCNGEADDRFVSTFLMLRNFSMWQIFSTFQRDNFRVQTEISLHGRIFLHRHRLWCLWQIWGMCIKSSACQSPLRKNYLKLLSNSFINTKEYFASLLLPFGKISSIVLFSFLSFLSFSIKTAAEEENLICNGGISADNKISLLTMLDPYMDIYMVFNNTFLHNTCLHQG